MNRHQKRVAHFAEMMNRIKEAPEFRVDQIKFEITEEICKQMKANSITRTELAERLNSSKAYVTKMLRGNSNFTLESLVKIAEALGCELNVRMCPEGFKMPSLSVSHRNKEADNQFAKFNKCRTVSFSAPEEPIEKEGSDESSNAA
jgi:transcriptional regulator with XRE-family HTH domain